MKKTINWSACFSVAFVWFTGLFGGGWATGATTFAWFAKHGWTALWMPMFGVVFVSVVSWITVEYARKIKAGHYRTFLVTLWGNKVVPTIYEFGTIMGAVICIATILSSSGSLAVSYGVNYWIGVAGMAAVCLLGCLFGASVVRKVASIMGIVIIALVVVLFVSVLEVRSNVVSYIVAERVIYTSTGKAAYGTFYFTAMTVGMMLSILPVTETLKSAKDTTAMILIGAIFQAIVLFMLNYTALAYMPEISTASVPFLFVAKELGSPVIRATYSVTLLFALITTGISTLYSYAVRFRSIVNTKSDMLSHVITILAFLIAGSALSVIGLVPLVSKGYTVPAYICASIVGIGIPLLTGIRHLQSKKTKKLS